MSTVTAPPSQIARTIPAGFAYSTVPVTHDRVALAHSTSRSPAMSVALDHPAAFAAEPTDRRDRDARPVRIERYYPVGAPFPRRHAVELAAVPTRFLPAF